MMKVYCVVCCLQNSDVDIDSVHTTKKGAESRVDEIIEALHIVTNANIDEQPLVNNSQDSRTFGYGDTRTVRIIEAELRRRVQKPKISREAIARRSDPIETDVRSFLQWFDPLEMSPDRLLLRYEPDTGMLHTPGCEGDYGCCSESFDLESFADSLRELLGEEQ